MIMKFFHIHRWKYYHNGLSRECKKCGAYEMTVGDTPSLSRLPGDSWVRTKEGKI